MTPAWNNARPGADRASPPVGRAFIRRSSVVVMAIVTAVVNLDLAADFAARRRRRMKVHVGGSVAQRADEFVVSAGGKLLSGRGGQDVGGRDSSFHRP